MKNTVFIFATQEIKIPLHYYLESSTFFIDGNETEKKQHLMRDKMNEKKKVVQSVEYQCSVIIIEMG